MSNKSNKRGKNAQFFPRQFFWCPRPAHDPNARNRLRKKLRKPQNNTAFAKISYLVNNCKPVSVGNSANVVFVARFSNQIVCFSTTSRDRKLPYKRKGTALFLLQTSYVQIWVFRLGLYNIVQCIKEYKKIKN